jgi:hypothetical protein
MATDRGQQQATMTDRFGEGNYAAHATTKAEIDSGQSTTELIIIFTHIYVRA